MFISIKNKLLITVLLSLCTTLICLGKDDSLNYQYSISGVSIAKDDFYLVEVSVLVNKKKEASLSTAQKYALVGCLYQGFVVGRISQRPMLATTNLDKKQQEYIHTLILENYNSFTSSSYPIQIVKVGKQYRVTTTILVAKDALMQNLQQAGIIRNLGL